MTLLKTQAETGLERLFELVDPAYLSARGANLKSVNIGPSEPELHFVSNMRDQVRFFSPGDEKISGFERVREFATEKRTKKEFAYSSYTAYNYPVKGNQTTVEFYYELL